MILKQLTHFVPFLVRIFQNGMLHILLFSVAITVSAVRRVKMLEFLDHILL